MRHVLIAIAAALCCSASFAAEPRTPVTIVGCVHKGTGRDSFVLTNVREISAEGSPLVTNLYWLSTTKGLSEHVNQKVEVLGTYSRSRDAGKVGTVKVDLNPAVGDGRVVVENGAKKAEAHMPLRPVGTSGVVAEFTKPYRRLEVESMKMIAASCDVP